MPNIVYETYRGLSVIRLGAGEYTARICPDMGGNVIQFSHQRLDTEALRIPPDAETFRDNPNVYGIPLLFPPNRIIDGTYTFQGRVYTFPINEPANNNFLHGVLSKTPMQVMQSSADESAATLTLRYQATADAPYLTFPHAFTVDLHYALTMRDGLTQTVSVTNDSAQDMPFGLGYHTAFHAPAESRVWVGVGREWLLERSRVRPTGEFRMDSPLKQALTGEGIAPQAGSVGGLFDNEGHRAVVRQGDADVIYEVDKGFRFWTLWNHNASSDFFCPEPQTWAIDAPNSPLPKEESGFDAIAPGDTRTLTTCLAIRKAE